MYLREEEIQKRSLRENEQMNKRFKWPVENPENNRVATNVGVDGVRAHWK